MPAWNEKLEEYRCGELFGPAADGSEPAFGNREWCPADADRAAAWELYTETRTRISSQPLALRHGDEEAALDSVYRLFELTREAIKDHPGCTHFATLMVHVLNVHVRPFTAVWQRKRIAGSFASRDTCHRFRRELAVLQRKLRVLMRLLGYLAEGDGFAPESASGIESAGAHTRQDLGPDIEFGVAGSCMPIADAAAIDAAERGDVLARRKTYGFEENGVNAVGLALSGGGIRSATFSLGVVQALARRGILKYVDFVSTVSGGGYLGAFLSTYLNDPDNPHAGLDPARHVWPFGRRGDVEAKPVRHLRNHGKYMAEGGLRARAIALGLMLYGIAINLVMSVPFVLAAVVVANYTLGAAFAEAAVGAVRFPAPSMASATLWLTGLLVASAALLPIVQAVARNAATRRSGLSAFSGFYETWWCVGLLVALFAVLAWSALPQGFRVYVWLVDKLSSAAASTVSVAGTSSQWGAALGLSAATLPFVTGALQVLVRKTRIAQRLVAGLLVVSGPLFFLTAFYALTDHFIVRDRGVEIFGWSLGPESGLLLLLAAVGLYGGVLLNVNYSSPHRFYRNRLSRTYLRRSVEHGEETAHVDDQLLSDLNRPGANGEVKAPYHLLNCALNIPGCKDPNLRGRASDFFLFSKRYSGSPTLGYAPTKEWEAIDGHLDLGTAMAVSAAAASPQMGARTLGGLSYLFAILNVRLNYWASTPRVPGAERRLRGPVKLLRWRTPGWFCFLKELTGLFMDERSRYVNLSDGGHVENLGLYELLRRRCKFIVAVDGEADPQRTFQGLLTLVRLAAIDLGVKIEPDLDELRIDERGDGKSHFLLCRIDYGEGLQGLLLYTKLSMTGNEPELLQKYRAEHPTFPHETTADQLFDESQFEAYRALGEHVAEELFRPELVDPIDPGRPPLSEQPTVAEWFQGLAGNLLDNDGATTP